MKNLLRTLKRRVETMSGFQIRRISSHKNPLSFLQNRIGTVIDIGANTGQFAREVRLLFPTATIYSFEPISACFRVLEESMKEDGRFKAFNVALGSTSEERDMFVSSYSPSSSLLPMKNLHARAFPHTQGHHSERIRVRTLDEMAPEIIINGDLLIKMDVQGFEAEVIRGGVATLSKASAIISETSFKRLYEAQPLFSDIQNALMKFGFAYAGSLGQKMDPRNGNILIQDSLFLPIRNPE